MAGGDSVCLRPLRPELAADKWRPSQSAHRARVMSALRQVLNEWQRQLTLREGGLLPAFVQFSEAAYLNRAWWSVVMRLVLRTHARPLLSTPSLSRKSHGF